MHYISILVLSLKTRHCHQNHVVLLYPKSFQHRATVVMKFLDCYTCRGQIFNIVYRWLSFHLVNYTDSMWVDLWLNHIVLPSIAPGYPYYQYIHAFWLLYNVPLYGTLVNFILFSYIFYFLYI